MDTARILRYLENAGYRNVVVNGDFVELEDPSCILRGFEDFLGYAWVGIYIITGLLLFGWGLSKIFGAKDDLFANMRNLIMVLVVLSVVKPVLNIIYGSDLFGTGCRTIQVSITEMEKLINSRQEALSLKKSNLYEDIDIYDSGPVETEEVELIEFE